MRKAEKRNLTKKEAKEKRIYVEGHHIFPKSIYGNNKRIVYLTGREHYFAHAVLERAFIQRYGLKDQRTIKMTHAHCRMKGNEGVYINSRLYEAARKRLSEIKTGQIRSKETIEKIRQKTLGRKQSPEEIEKRKQSCAGLVYWNNGVENKVAKIPPGKCWVRGKLTLEKKYWWTNGEENKKSATCPGEGWYKGFTTSLSKNKVPAIWWTNGFENKKRVNCPGEGWYQGKTSLEEISKNKGVNIKRSTFSSQGCKWWNNGERQVLSLDRPGDEWNLGPLPMTKKWWNNGEKNVRSDECPGKGWIPGMIVTENMVGQKLWNNGIEQKYFKEHPGEGWVLGELPSTTKEKVWWTNGKKTKRCANCPGDGWIRGHNFDRTTNKNADYTNYKWWNNGVENQFTPECPGEGWIRGMIIKTKYHWWTNGKDNVFSPECPEGNEWYSGMVRKPRKNK